MRHSLLETLVSPVDSTLVPKGAFSLAASIRFLSGFTPLAHDEGADKTSKVLRLAFSVERDWRPAAVSVEQAEDGSVTVRISGDADSDLVIDQTVRMLSLDVDASTLEQTLRDDKVAAELVCEFCGLRPVCFASAYEAAAWSVISQRVQMRQAAKIRLRMCEQLGHRIDVDGHTLHSFLTRERCGRRPPSPACPRSKSSACTSSPTPPSTAGWTPRRCAP